MKERPRPRSPKPKGRSSGPRARREATRSSGGRRSGGGRSRVSSTGAQWSALKRAFGSLTLTLALSLLGLFFWSVFSRPQKQKNEWVLFEVSSDSEQILRDLYHEQLVDSPSLMGLYLRYLTPWSELRPGLHLLEQGLSARELAQRLTADPARPTENVTLIEGWNRWDIADRLHEKGIVARSAFLQAVQEKALLAELAILATSAEGYLFPATYPMRLDSDARAVVGKLVRETRKRIARIKARAENGSPRAISEHELLTLASVVEKETGRPEERARVAQVFFNRLAQPEGETLGRLQSDPTAAYGCRLATATAPSCAGFSGRITPKMLADVENPYNTYRHPGLPPGPIANPGSESIEAVLFPSGGQELFFVADGKGGHTFSVTYEQHRTAVKRLRDKKGSETTPP